MEPIRLPARSPHLNAYVEQFVRSIKEECLSRVLLLSEQHLRFIVHEYVEHDHRERNHQGLNNELLTPSSRPADPSGDVQRRERIGGLLNYFYRESA